MKKRVRTRSGNQFYSTEPAVATNKMADKAPVQNASLGNSTPRMVDRKPGKISGLAGFMDKKRPHAKAAVGVPSNKVPQKKTEPKQGMNGKIKKIKGL